MKQPTKTQTGPLYPNLWAEAQYNAKPWAMANKINATEEVVVKIIWGKEPLHMDEATALGYGEGKSLANAVANHVDEEDKGVTELMTPGSGKKCRKPWRKWGRFWKPWGLTLATPTCGPIRPCGGPWWSL